ncbi:helix-turn-helix domain-containing protein [Brevibacillus reuszeri]|uniref:helix-turn-helix domain-containing protein n=1 Tax=Brevibacillus reuszeri TaxID=54915 RepID=UPI000CCC6569|nr:helix-turn-helix domain-containing protein [Brevibacillus reuszeri]
MKNHMLTEAAALLGVTEESLLTNNEGISCNDAAKILGVTPKTVWLKAKSSELPSTSVMKKGRLVYRFQLDDIFRYKEELAKFEPEVLSNGSGVYLFQRWNSSEGKTFGRVVKIEQSSKSSFTAYIQTEKGSLLPEDDLRNAGWVPELIVIENKKRKYMNGTVTLSYPKPKNINDAVYDHFLFLFAEFGLNNIQLIFLNDTIVIETKKYTSTSKWDDFHFQMLVHGLENGGGSITQGQNEFTLEPDLEGYLANLSGEKRRAINHVIQVDQTTKQDLVESGMDLYLKTYHPQIYNQLKDKGLIRDRHKRE